MLCLIQEHHKKKLAAAGRKDAHLCPEHTDFRHEQSLVWMVVWSSQRDMVPESVQL